MDFEFYLFFEVFRRTLIIYFGILIGYLFILSPLRRYKSVFVDITLNLLTPYLIIVSFLRIDISSSFFFPILAFLIVTILGITTPIGISKIWKHDTPSPAELCTSTFSNGLNFPFPVIFALAPNGLGAAGVFLAFSIIARNSLGFWISRSSLTLKEMVKQIILFPPIWGVLAGLILRITSQPYLLPMIDHPIAEIIFQIGIFATLMTVGFSIQKPNFNYKIPVIRVGLTRFIFSGIVAIIILFILRPPRFLGVPFLVQTISPPAVYNGLYAEKLGLDTELTSQIIVILTLVALLFLPIELLFLELFYLS